jgi:large subunit ribosomal protein L24
MQKVFRRTALAIRQHERRAVKRKEKNLRQWATTQRQQNTAFGRDKAYRLKEEKLNRREDYELGPLRPKRDVGDLKNEYGTLDNQALQGLPLPQKELFKRLEPFGGKYLNIWKGDRVVILQGPDKGKIGVISAIDGKKAKVTVKDLNKVRIISFQTT